MLILSGMNSNDPAMLHFDADDRAVAVALAAVRRFAAASGLAADPAARLAIVVEELVTNIVDHGGAPGTSIGLALAAAVGEIRLTLVDEGRPFDPRAAAVPAVIPDRGGGVGLALVRAWTRLNYAHADGRNRLAVALPVNDATPKNKSVSD